MEKYDLLVIDLRGERGDEQNRLAEIADKNWTLVSVVSLPLCRRAYFQRKSVEPSEITARREATLRILRNETIEPAERVHLALLIAAGPTELPSEQKTVNKGWHPCLCSCHSQKGLTVGHCIQCCTPCPTCGLNVVGDLEAHTQEEHPPTHCQ